MATCSFAVRWACGVGSGRLSTLDEAWAILRRSARFSGSSHATFSRAFFCVVAAREALCRGVDGGQRLRPR